MMYYDVYKFSMYQGHAYFWLYGYSVKSIVMYCSSLLTIYIYMYMYMYMYDVIYL